MICGYPGYWARIGPIWAPKEPRGTRGLDSGAVQWKVAGPLYGVQMWTPKGRIFLERGGRSAQGAGPGGQG